MAVTHHTLPPKDPQDVLDYAVDFTNLLESGETIATHVVAITPAGLTLDSSSTTVDEKSVVFIVSGGDVGVTYAVTVTIQTTGGSQARTFERTCLLTVEDR